MVGMWINDYMNGSEILCRSQICKNIQGVPFPFKLNLKVSLILMKSDVLAMNEEVIFELIY